MKITEAHINLLLAEAAMLRSSYLGGDGEVLPDEDENDSTQLMYRHADMFDDLAVALAPLAVPPLSEVEQQCADCEGGVKWERACNSCRGTGLWPLTTKDGVRLRLLPEEPV